MMHPTLLKYVCRWIDQDFRRTDERPLAWAERIYRELSRDNIHPHDICMWMMPPGTLHVNAFWAAFLVKCGYAIDPDGKVMWRDLGDGTRSAKSIF